MTYVPKKLAEQVDVMFPGDQLGGDAAWIAGAIDGVLLGAQNVLMSGGIRADAMLILCARIIGLLSQTEQDVDTCTAAIKTLVKQADLTLAPDPVAVTVVRAAIARMLETADDEDGDGSNSGKVPS